jgi:hypothetical protein
MLHIAAVVLHLIMSSLQFYVFARLHAHADESSFAASHASKQHLRAAILAASAGETMLFMTTVTAHAPTAASNCAFLAHFLTLQLLVPAALDLLLEVNWRCCRWCDIQNRQPHAAERFALVEYSSVFLSEREAEAWRTLST